MGTDSESRISQFRKGVVELAILALLHAGEAYGVAIVDALASHPGLAISAGTVYPLLSRLKKAGLIDSVWRESPVGPPRKYYRLTAAGVAEFERMSGEWAGVVSAMDELMSEGGAR
ncbi:MAG: PadR family transcriptional regulator [Coriobacteriia bacterium]|nr:PadR family transcriptional regulator [Coriobacteriia bacterium]